jgi:hypothetical protein
MLIEHACGSDRVERVAAAGNREAHFGIRPPFLICTDAGAS